MEYKRVPMEFVEHTELAKKSLEDYNRRAREPDEAEAEDRWIADRKRLYAVLDRLTPRQRRVYILKVGYGLTEEKIAEKLGVAQQVVSRHYQAACRKIQKVIGK